MTKYIQFDAAGVLANRFDDTVNDDIPADAIEVSDDLFQQTMQETDGIWTLHADGGITKQAFPPPTAEQIQFSNKVIRDGLLAVAALAIAPLQDAVDLEIDTPAEAALLKAWKQYRVALNRVDLTQAVVAWPAAPGGAA
ncbi:tail fiber assembly protein [Amantichitinum ursilacus]|uniref:Caudovirales tail fiber assembly protein n=1 Tax=Amantichitinum ursilacus TaxID=857265 RepID=A0A0N0XL62_9NEIS|nr:tail assembly chaperone [Amantichitinum ursilacus]KPC53038.1 Caudovirales tail fiber assembly protein [Amantichitinum ursilacus]